MPQGKLVRIPEGQIFGGVCTGLARYFNADVTIVRLVVAAIVVFTGIGPLAYIGAWLAIPKQGEDASALESLVGQAKQWNAQRTIPGAGTHDQAPYGQGPDTDEQQPPETFNLYDDRR